MFIEFGSGIYYNAGNEHPLAKQFGYGVGTYPGQTHAYEDFWFYTDKDGTHSHFSHGTEATMPMYNSVIEMYKTEEFNYSVWHKNDLHNVYTYIDGTPYEYEYFIEDGKIKLEEVLNKQYKR